jgi:small conductance mechanosensitive channel
LNQFSLKALTDSAIQLAVRPWAIKRTFACVYMTLEDCKNAFDAEGITIQPFADVQNQQNSFISERLLS